MNMPVFERLQAADVPAVLRLNQAVDWSFSAEDVQTQLAAGSLFGLRQGADLVATGGIFDFGSYAAIGIIMIAPERQRQGLGAALMQHLHAQARPAQPLVLIATAQGAPLYSRLGYRVAAELHNLVAPFWTAALPARVRAVSGDDDLAQLSALDRAATGGDRRHLVQARLQQAESAWFYLDGKGQAVGYALGVRQHRQLIAGPVVAPDVDAALALVDAVVSAGKDFSSVRIDLAQAAGLPGLQARGFVLRSLPPVMVRGADQLPGYGAAMVAIAAQAYG